VTEAGFHRPAFDQFTTPARKPRMASDAAFLQAIMDAEGMTLEQQKTALQKALTAVLVKLQAQTHERNV
jgi:hypothetical protein